MFISYSYVKCIYEGHTGIVCRDNLQDSMSIGFRYGDWRMYIGLLVNAQP